MYIVADIGGTKMRVAASSDLEALGEPVFIDTPAEYDAAVAAFCESAKRLAGSDAIEAVAIGLRGVLAPDKRSLGRDTILSHWVGKPLADDIQNALDAKRVIIENDTALDALGEATHGAGQGASIVAYVTVSTGMNGARVVDGRIDKTKEGFEIGGQYLATTGTTSLEELISGKSIHERFGMHPKELGKEHPVWEELAQTLAYGIHNTILHWSPERVVFGGSMFNEIGIPVGRVHEHVGAIMHKFATVPEFVHASLGDACGLWGGLELLKQER